MDDEDAGAKDPQQTAAEPSAAGPLAETVEDGHQVEEVVEEEDQVDKAVEKEDQVKEVVEEGDQLGEDLEQEDQVEEVVEEGDQLEEDLEQGGKVEVVVDEGAQVEETKESKDLSPGCKKVKAEEENQDKDVEELDNDDLDDEDEEEGVTPSDKADNHTRTEMEESQQGGSWDEHPMLLSVVLLTMNLLKDCNALQRRSLDLWAAHSHRLISKTMAGVTHSEGLSPDDKAFQKVCDSVVATLEKRFGSKRVLDSVILLEHPEVDAVIVECLQKHLEDESAWLASGGRCPRHCLNRWLVGSAAVGTAVTGAVLFGCLYFFL